MAEGGVSVQALELQVKSNATGASGSLTALANSLGKIRDQIQNGLNLGTVASQLGSFVKNLSTIGSKDDVERITALTRSVTGLVTALKGLNGVKGAMKEVADAAKATTSEYVGKHTGSEYFGKHEAGGYTGRHEVGSISEAAAASERLTEGMATARAAVTTTTEEFKAMGAAAREASKEAELTGSSPLKSFLPHAAEQLAQQAAAAKEYMDLVNKAVGNNSGTSGPVEKLGEGMATAEVRTEEMKTEFASISKAATETAAKTGETAENLRNAIQITTNNKMSTWGTRTPEMQALRDDMNARRGMNTSGFGMLGRGDVDRSGFVKASEALAGKLSDASAAALDLKTNIEGVAAAGGTASGSVAETGASMKAAAASSEEVAGKTSMIYNIITAVRSGFDTAKTAIHGASGAIAAFIEHLHEAHPLTAMLKSGLSSLSAGFKKLKGAILSAHGGLLGFLSGMARMAKYRLFRSLIRHITEGFSEGLKNVREFSKSVNGLYNKDMSALDNTVLKMKNSLGAALASAIQSLIPLFQQLAQWVITVSNYINQFIALISGRSSWTRAVDVIANVEEETKKSGKTAKSTAKEVKNLLASWDELNIIQSESGGGGGGAGSGIKDEAEETQVMFEEVTEFDNKIRDIVQWLEDHLWVVNAIIGTIIGKLLGLTLPAIALTLGIAFSYETGEKAGASGEDFLSGLKDNVENFIIAALGGAFLGWSTTHTVSGALTGLIVGLSLSFLAYSIGWIQGNEQINGGFGFKTFAKLYLTNVISTALAGMAIGFTVGGPHGAIVGLALGAALGLGASVLEWEKRDKTEFDAASWPEMIRSNIAGIIGTSIAGLVVGSALASASGVLIGLTVGAAVGLGIVSLGWGMNKLGLTPIAALSKAFKEDAAGLIGPAVELGLTGFIIGKYAGMPIKGALIGITVGALLSLGMKLLQWSEEGDVTEPPDTFGKALSENLKTILLNGITGGILGAVALGGSGGALVGIIVGSAISVVGTAIEWDKKKTEARLREVYGSTVLTDEEIDDLAKKFFTGDITAYVTVTGAKVTDIQQGRESVQKAITALMGSYTALVTIGWSEATEDQVDGLWTQAKAVVDQVNAYLETYKIAFGAELSYSYTDEKTGEIYKSAILNAQSLQDVITEFGNDIGKILADGVVDEFEEDALAGLMNAVNRISVAVTTGQKAGEIAFDVQSLISDYSDETNWSAETFKGFEARYDKIKTDAMQTAKDAAKEYQKGLFGLAYGMQEANEELIKTGRGPKYSQEEIDKAFEDARNFPVEDYVNMVYQQYIAPGEEMYQKFWSNVYGKKASTGVSSKNMNITGSVVKGANDQYLDLGILEFGRPLRNWVDANVKKGNGNAFEYSLLDLDSFNNTLLEIEREALGLDTVEQVGKYVSDAGPYASAWTLLDRAARDAVFAEYEKAGYGTQLAEMVSRFYGDNYYLFKELNDGKGTERTGITDSLISDETWASYSDKTKKKLMRRMVDNGVGLDYALDLAQRFDDQSVIEMFLDTWTEGWSQSDYERTSSSYKWLMENGSLPYRANFEYANYGGNIPNAGIPQEALQTIVDWFAEKAKNPQVTAPNAPSVGDEDEEDKDATTGTEQKKQGETLNSMLAAFNEFKDKRFSVTLSPSPRLGQIVYDSLNMYERSMG